jgi:transposase
MGKAYRVSLSAGREELSQVLAHLQNDALNAQDRHLLMHLLQQMLGPASGSPSPPAAATGGPSASVPSPDPPSSTESEPTRRRGHGPHHATSYTGARQVSVAHPCLHPGDRCPEPGCRGHLFDTRQPSRFLRFTGEPFIRATRYEQQVLRCSTCQQRYRAPLPNGVPAEKYDPSADVALVMAKYAAGIPFYRLARLQQAYGVPLPESTQWERCEAVADALLPVFLHLRRLATCAEVLIGDDTRVQILSCAQENRQRSEGERHGLHTTGIVATTEPPHSVILYQSGRRHAGENVGALLQTRPQELGPPLQVGDALAANWSHHLPVIAVKCLAHLRRQFTDIEELFPEECRRVREALARVYRTETETRDMTPEQRLAHHQRHSAPAMEELRGWIEQQFQQRRVEPNSALGKAFRYVQRHWDGVTQFLRHSNAPLDSNAVERALKRVVLHRKNALFFRTEHGAAVGDILMSVIETCRANGVGAAEYLAHIVRNASGVRQQPGRWLPWSYALTAPP